MTAPRYTRLAPGERRRQILQAAAAVFADTPYADVTLDAVARRAGVSRALVTHYFAGKEGLLAALLQAIAQAAPDVVRTDLGLSAEETADRNMRAWLDQVEAYPRPALMLAGVGRVGLGAELEQALDEAREVIVDRIVANQLGGVEPPPPVRVALRAWTGLYDVALREWLHHGRATREQVHRLLTGALLAIIRDVVPAMTADGDDPPGALRRGADG